MHHHLRLKAAHLHYERAINVMRRVLRNKGVVLCGRGTVGSTRFLLFFDGGSRGNPGPGGGAVVLSLGTDAASYNLCWVGSMAYGLPRMTNDLAESLGLSADAGPAPPQASSQGASPQGGLCLMQTSGRTADSTVLAAPFEGAQVNG